MSTTKDERPEKLHCRADVATFKSMMQIILDAVEAGLQNLTGELPEGHRDVRPEPRPGDPTFVKLLRHEHPEDPRCRAGTTHMVAGWADDYIVVIIGDNEHEVHLDDGTYAVLATW